MRFVTFALVLIAAGLAIHTPPAWATYCGITAAANRRHCDRHLGKHADHCDAGCGSKTVCEDSCYTVMKTMTRTFYERVTEQKEVVVYDTVWEQQTVQDVRRVAEVQSRTEQFTYQRPVYETVTQQVPFTVYRQQVETRTRDVAFTTYARSYETRVRSVPYTVHHTVCETSTHTVFYRVPRQVCETRTVQVRSGHWETRIEEYPCGPAADVKGEQKSEQKSDPSQKGGTIKVHRRVWVPCYETREVPYTRTVYDLQTMEVPRTVKRVVAEVRTRDVEYTVCRFVPVTQTRPVCYQVVHQVPEHRMRTVTSVIAKAVTEVGVRTVPCTTIREIPVTRTINVPRQVPRTVTCTVTRSVPRCETYQVPVRICVPTQKCDPGKKGATGKKGDTDSGSSGEVPKPTVAEPENGDSEPQSAQESDRSA